MDKGSHSMKMGADVRRDRFDTIYGSGQTVFGSIFTFSSNSPNSGAPLADFLLGYPAQLTARYAASICCERRLRITVWKRKAMAEATRHRENVIWRLAD